MLVSLSPQAFVPGVCSQIHPTGPVLMLKVTEAYTVIPLTTLVFWASIQTAPLAVPVDPRGAIIPRK